MLQQCLPLAVLKLAAKIIIEVPNNKVATVLTACGIETPSRPFALMDLATVATVLTACGIETG